MAQVKRKRPKIGDVIEIETPKGLAYAQYIHKHDKPPKYGALMRVLPGLYKSRPSEFAKLVHQPERFFVFFPLGAAVSRGIVQIVASEDVPVWAHRFPLMRMAGGRDRSGRVLNWWLWDGEREWKVEKLTEEQRNLSIAQVWNDTMLIERIAEGWSPADEGQ